MSTANQPAKETASIATLAAMVREMPMSQAREFLAGLLPLMAETEAVSQLRAAFIAINQSDSQLELIASQQARLAL